jgi:two-component system, cell cycle sensor histidine kinase and response regulator CckA
MEAASLDENELERRVAERTAELQAANRTTEQSLRDSEARFRALIENAFDITAISDGAGVLRYVSPSVERILGYAPQELEGSRFLAFVHPDDASDLEEGFGRAVSQPRQVQLQESRARHKDGTWRLMDLVCLNQLDNPAVRGMVFNVRDVTTRRALETRLHQSERLDAIGQLAGGVAHDFNNILLVIRGYSSVLRSTLADPHHIADVDEIVSAADRAAELTRHLLAFGRRQVLQPRLVSVVETVCGLESLLRHSIRENVELNLDLADNVPAVLADPVQIEQVILNLVVNGRDAMAAGGVVRLSVGTAELTGAEEGISPALPHGTYVVLAVADTGTGIAAEVLPHIFDPFFTTKEDGVGTGLGLSTVYGIVVQSGGGIDVRSLAGGGTTFTVYLPVAERGSEYELSVGEADASLPGGTETVLLVEDEAAVRELVRRVLESAGYRVLQADRPSEAERLLAEEEEVDLLLTDVVMPEMSGYELAARALERRPELRAMFMSGYSHPGAGPQQVPGELLQKPFTTDELTQTIRKTLDS